MKKFLKEFKEFATRGNMFDLAIGIMALVVFVLVKIINRLRTPRHAEEQAPTTKKCPFCCSEIDIKATKCPHCTSLIEVDKDEMKA